MRYPPGRANGGCVYVGVRAATPFRHAGGLSAGHQPQIGFLGIGRNTLQHAGGLPGFPLPGFLGGAVRFLRVIWLPRGEIRVVGDRCPIGLPTSDTPADKGNVRTIGPGSGTVGVTSRHIVVFLIGITIF